MATAGIVCGVISLALTLLWFAACGCSGCLGCSGASDILYFEMMEELMDL